MKIGLIDADLLDNGTRHPNLASMKLSAYYKSKGHNVKLLNNYNNIKEYDKVIISKVFSFTNVPINIDEYNNIEIGGTGFFSDGGEKLKNEIEHMMPDYSLYDEYIKREIERGIKEKKFKDYKNFSIGFATRGCFRKCEFCVNKKYSKVQRHAPIKEFYDRRRKYIYLWDDNILGYAHWKEVFLELKETNRYFQFRQGLDIRLLTEEKAKILSNSKYYGDFIFAFDHIEDKDLIIRKLKIWNKYRKKTTKLYVLCGYDSQNEDDIANTFERIKILMKYKCLPYIMRYEDYEDSEYRGMYINLARWCNQPNFFKKMSFREFCIANQEAAKTKKTCATLRYMNYFEKKNPEIAKKYFDIKYENF